MKNTHNIKIGKRRTIAMGMVFGIAALAMGRFVTDARAEQMQNRSISVYFGDFDYDGKVTLSDAQKALKLALKIEPVTEEQKLFGDMDGDGIGLTDAKEYLKMSLRIVPPKKTELTVPIDGEQKHFTDETSKVEAVKVSDRDVWSYLSTDSKEIPDVAGNNGMPMSFLYKVHTQADIQFGTKVTLMNLFNLEEKEIENYEYFVGLYRSWCDKFGYENLKISVENNESQAVIGLYNATSYFEDEIGGEGVTSTLNDYMMIFKVPKAELNGKTVYKSYGCEYGQGYEKAKNVDWTFSKVTDVDQVTPDACLITTSDAVDVAWNEKCDFEQYDYIMITIPFNLKDTYDFFFAPSWSDDSYKKTVGEMYHTGEISRPTDFDAATYLNDRVFMNINEMEKVLHVKTNFTLYDQFYYEDVANQGIVVVPVPKGQYRDYELVFDVFGRDLSLFTMD